MPSLSFTKMSGTGNDFLIFDARGADFPKFDRSLFVKAVCRRQHSVGADGVVFIEKAKSKSVAFKWDFYNSDGSVAEMCGNASRCVGRYAIDHDVADKAFSFQTIAGTIGVRVQSKGMVEVEMTKPVLVEDKLQIPVEGKNVQISFWNTGVPHAVIETDDWSETWLLEAGAYLRSHQFFKKYGGTNVTFYSAVDSKAIESATFERGVESITLACGTGAVAAAATAVKTGKMRAPVEVHVPGGVLHVNFGQDLSSAQLAGEVRYIFEGTLHQEALL